MTLQLTACKVRVVEPGDLDSSVKDAAIAAVASDRRMDLVQDITSIEMEVEDQRLQADIHTVTRDGNGYLDYVILRCQRRDGTVDYFVVDHTDNAPHWSARQFRLNASIVDTLVVDSFSVIAG